MNTMRAATPSGPSPPTLAAAAAKRSEVQKYMVDKLGPLFAVTDQEVTVSLFEAIANYFEQTRATDVVGVPTSKHWKRGKCSPNSSTEPA